MWRQFFSQRKINMDKSSPVLLTSEGLNELKQEYQQLTEIKRPEAVTRLSKAREAGDLTENGEYSAAREELAFVDGRIAEIDSILQKAQRIRKRKVSKDSRVAVGCKVHLDVKGRREVFTIVGEWEADPTEKKISHESPLGKALLGKKRGEKVEVEAPAGKIIYKILRIE